MTGKQATVGWLGILLIVANVLDGTLRPALHLITTGGTHDHSGGGLSLIPGLPKIPIPGLPGGGGLPKIPNLPGPIPQGPITGVPFSPISYTPTTQTNPGALPNVWA